jgi:hypothetical protein
MSFGQPSPQGIAKLFRGNPGKLEADIKQEQQAKPGMPPDLAKLMALSINVNEMDAVKRQQAMAALQSMQQQAPTGKPPTVAESLQQQAMQKARQLAVQQQQQQKGLQALMGQAAPMQTPERPPQPERQGSLEELQSNLGQEYASGGIIAFAEPTDENNRSLVKDPNADEDTSSQFVRDIAKLPKAFDDLKQRAREEDAIRKAQDLRMAQRKQEMLEARGKTSLFNYLFGSPQREQEGMAKLAELSNAPLSKTPAVPVVAATSPVDIRAQLNRADAARYAEPASAAPVRDIAALAAQKQRTQNAAAAATTNAPAAPAAPTVQSARDKFLAAQYAQTPEQRRADVLNRYEAQIGGPDTAAQEAYIKMLQGKVGGMDEPTDMYDRARNYARKLALAGGRTSLQTGANASAMLETDRLANEQKKLALLKEIMGESTKVADVKRGYKKEMFGIGEKEYDEAYKNTFDAAKEQGLDDREAKRLAQQSAENALNRANQIKVAQIGADARTSGAGGADKQQLAELKALQASKTGQLKNAYGSDKKRLQSELATIEAAIAKMAGLDTMGTAPGAVSPGGTRPPLSSFQR